MFKPQHKERFPIKKPKDRAIRGQDKSPNLGNSTRHPIATETSPSHPDFVVQLKLKIGSPDDEYEQEADRVADQVMRMPEPQIKRQQDEEEEVVQTKPVAGQTTPLVQRQVEEEEEEIVQPKRIPGSKRASPASPAKPVKDGGQPLLEPARSYFETRFAHDFSRVRTHSDSRAAQMADQLNARSFTKGNDIVFGAGQYNPHSVEGRRLLAHELTHVVQQTKGSSTQGPRQDLRPETAVSKVTSPGVIQKAGGQRRRRRRGGIIIRVNSRPPRFSPSADMAAVFAAMV